MVSFKNVLVITIEMLVLIGGLVLQRTMMPYWINSFPPNISGSYFINVNDMCLRHFLTYQLVEVSMCYFFHFFYK